MSGWCASALRRGNVYVRRKTKSTLLCPVEFCLTIGYGPKEHKGALILFSFLGALMGANPIFRSMVKTEKSN